MLKGMVIQKRTSNLLTLLESYVGVGPSETPILPRPLTPVPLQSSPLKPAKKKRKKDKKQGKDSVEEGEITCQPPYKHAKGAKTA